MINLKKLKFNGKWYSYYGGTPLKYVIVFRKKWVKEHFGWKTRIVKHKYKGKTAYKLYVRKK